MFEFELLEKDVPVEYTEDEHDSTKDFEPSFWYYNQRYYLSDFSRVHNNPYLGLSYGDTFPDYIHGMQDDGSNQSYTNPLYIEICEGSDTVNIYKEVA